MDVNTLYTYIGDHFGIKTEIWEIVKSETFFIIKIKNTKFNFYFLVQDLKKKYCKVAPKILECHATDTIIPSYSFWKKCQNLFYSREIEEEPIISNFGFFVGSMSLYHSQIGITLYNMGWGRLINNLYDPCIVTTTKSIELFLNDFFSILFSSSKTSYFLNLYTKGLYHYICDYFGMETDMWKIVNDVRYSIVTIFINSECENIKYYFKIVGEHYVFRKREQPIKILEFHADEQEPIISNFCFYASSSWFHSSHYKTLDKIGWVVKKPELFGANIFTTKKSIEPFLEDFFGVFSSSSTSSTSYFLK
jgi:hypothetical protein